MGDAIVERDPLGRSRWTKALSRGLHRYDPVVLAVCAMALLARFGPGAGGGGIDRLAQDRAGFGAVVTPPLLDVFPEVAPGPGPAPEPRAPLAPPPSSAAGPAPRAEPRAQPAPAAVATTSPRPAARVGDVTAFAVLGAEGEPGGLAAARGGDVFVGVVAEGGRASVRRIGPDGREARRYALEHLAGAIADIELGADGRLYVLGAEPARMVAIDPASGAETPYAELPDAPPCLPLVPAAACDGSVVDRAPRAAAFAFDRDGRAYVTDSNQGAVWRIGRGGGDVEQFFVDADLAGPVGLEGGRGIHGIAVDGAGHLVYSAERLGDGPGGVLLHEVDGGEPGRRTLLYQAGDEERPGHLALGASGRLYVGMRSGGRILVLDPDGKVRTRVPAAEGALGTPRGLAFQGSGLLVATTVDTPQPANVILRVETGEGGRT